MKRNKIIHVVFALLSALLVFESSSVSVYANSAQSWWEGVDSSGAVVTDEDSPIVVEREVLTFDIQEFPANYYREVDEFLAYSGKVTAEYTLYNPAEYTVTAKLLFPFGNAPSYADFYDYETEIRTYNIDTEKYDITINGETIPKTIRHTLTYPYAQFILEKDIALLSDEYILELPDDFYSSVTEYTHKVPDDFYSPELCVTKYTYKISGVDLDEYHAANVAFDVAKNLDSTVVFFPEQSGCHTQNSGDMRISAWVDKNGQMITLYAIGEPFSTAPKWKFYKNGGVEDKEEIDGKATLESMETLTFEEFALADWKEQSGVSKTDWYNAVVAELREDDERYDHPIVDLERYKQGYEGNLMRWYEYEIVIEPGARIVNAVTAPIYPSIGMDYTPAIHGYKYLLSPAKTWAEFGELEIVLNTPYYMTESSIEGFTKTDNGYVLSLEGLPEGELEFTLCSAENPQKEVRTIRDYVPIEIIISFSIIGILLLSGGIIVFVLVRKSQI